jgi:hypothetical protein
MIRDLPMHPHDASTLIYAEHFDPEAYRVMWTSYMPLHAAARTGKVHLTTADSFPRTLCGRMIPYARNRFHPRPDDPPCTRCDKKWKATSHD